MTRFPVKGDEGHQHVSHASPVPRATASAFSSTCRVELSANSPLRAFHRASRVYRRVTSGSFRTTVSEVALARSPRCNGPSSRVTRFVVADAAERGLERAVSWQGRGKHCDGRNVSASRAGAGDVRGVSAVRVKCVGIRDVDSIVSVLCSSELTVPRPKTGKRLVGNDFVVSWEVRRAEDHYEGLYA